LAGLPVPEIVFIDLPADLARTEPDPEIQSLIRGSAGLNVALDYLPGSITFDPLIYRPDEGLASAVVWLDAYVCNVDRTVRNANMLLWHRRLWLIDHGAALYFHHAWTGEHAYAASPFGHIKNHILLRDAARLEEVDVRMKGLLVDVRLAGIVGLIPDEWLADDPGFGRQAQRDAYLDFFRQRLQASAVFVGEAIRARLAHL
jgi:hypothetical protein